MIKHFGFFVILQCLLQNPSFSVSSNFVSHRRQTEAVANLVKRLVGEPKSRLFNITVVTGTSAAASSATSNLDADRDWFSAHKLNESIHIIASSGVAAAYGFHYYLKNHCNCHVSWDHDQLNLPAVLPPVNVSIRSLDRYRYYQNVCTHSYSYAWWTWRRWERELDWMALNGFNLALAWGGQEAIWRRVYRQLNMTEADIDAHLAGPAFLAWQRMGNIRGWGGPLTEMWHQQSLRLQHNVLERMAELGIQPILPAFCGIVPVATARLFPHAKMTTLPAWSHFSGQFCCPYLLDPAEPLFRTIGAMFMREMSAEFGQHSVVPGFYNCDTFNENLPPNSDLQYLANMTSTIFHTINNSDANATWILQGWLFADHQLFWTPQRVKHFLGAVPDNRMIVLDLQSELRPQYFRLESYFGKPFIWCMLHNFGGTLGMHGSLSILNTEIARARRTLPNSTLIGTGLTPEGINQNYVVYDFMAEVSWRHDDQSSVNLSDWIRRYAARRYGKSDNLKVTNAWLLLKNSIYNYSGSDALHGRYTLCVRPELERRPAPIWYNRSDVFDAWHLMATISDEDILKNANFRHDLVDLTRQVLQLQFDQLFETLIANFRARNETTFFRVGQRLLDLLLELDMVLSTDSRFMLGNWICEAKSRGSTRAERKNFVMNAKNQITLWGPNGEVLDYATKQWSGVILDYYYPRWRLFCQSLYVCMKNKIPFHQKIFDKMVFAQVEKPFVDSYKQYPTIPQNDTLAIVKLLHDKWRMQVD